jgi:hypothetical protein
MPARRRPRPTEKPSDIFVGEVVAHMPGSNRIHVRMTNRSGRALRNVITAVNEPFRSGDRALIIKAPNEEHWIAVTRVNDTAEWGGLGGTALSTPESSLYPPTNFAVFGTRQALIALWDIYPGFTACYEVQINSSASATGATSWYTRGSHYIYEVTEPVTKYMRVRSLIYDMEEITLSYSGWSAWDSASSAGPHTANAILAAELDYQLTRHVISGI